MFVSVPTVKRKCLKFKYQCKDNWKHKLTLHRPSIGSFEAQDGHKLYSLQHEGNNYYYILAEDQINTLSKCYQKSRDFIPLIEIV